MVRRFLVTWRRGRSVTSEKTDTWPGRLPRRWPERRTEHVVGDGPSASQKRSKALKESSTAQAFRERWLLFLKRSARLSPHVPNLGKILKERANGAIVTRWKRNKSARKPLRTRKNTTGKQFLLTFNHIFRTFRLYFSPHPNSCKYTIQENCVTVKRSTEN